MINEATPGGGQLHLLWLCEEISKKYKDFNITVLANESGFLTDECRKNNIRYHIIRIKRFPSLSQLFKLKQIFKNEQPDIVHVHGGVAALWVKLTKLIFGASFKIIYTYHGIHFHYFKNVFRKYAFWFVDFITKWQVDHFILISQSVYSLSQFYHLTGKNNSTIILNGIQEPGKKLGERDISDFRKTNNINASDFIIGTIARFDPAKGYSVFLDVAEKMTDKYHDIHFVIIGDGPERKSIEKRISTISGKTRIHLLGSITNASKYIECFNVFLLTSIFEGLGLVLIESFYFRRPVVASNIGGIPEIVSDGKNGFLVSVGNVDNFADRLTELYYDRQLSGKMGNSGYDLVMNSFGIERMTRETVEVYRKLL